jgi:membrane-associated phospholipid phosphatase
MKRSLRRWYTMLLAATLASVGMVVARPAAAFAATTATASTVFYWNDTLLEAFRRQVGGPGPLARAAAMMYGSLFDVLNSAQWGRQSYVGSGYHAAFTLADTSSAVDDNLAAGIAARDALIDALPQQSAYVQQRFTQRHGSASQTEATNLAAQVVAAERQNRANDGANATPSYTLDGVPGSWRPTGGACTTAVDPHWGRVRPFVMTSTTQFRQPLPGGFTTYPALLASSLYATVVNEVQSLGKSNSTTRTADQTQAAFFWANDANGTYKPPGQLLAHTRLVAEPRITNPIALARLFTQVSFAMGDAAIAAWDEKYLTPIDLWRPVTAIQMADTDNNAATVRDATWQPLGATPCFPAWVSGHATFAAAWAGVMRAAFGDNVTFTGGTEDPNAAGVTRTFTSFTQAATEDARSRIYLGVHYQFDADDGMAIGTNIANSTTANKFGVLKCIDPCIP